MEQILNRFSKAVLLAANGNGTPLGFIPHALHDLSRLETRPSRLTEITYEWCSVIYENREKIEGWESLLLLCLKLGFRHLDSWDSYTNAKLTLIHTEHHRELVGVVFKSQNSEAIADLLQAWTTRDSLPELAGEMVGICTGHLVGLHNPDSFSPRLRQLVVHFVKIAGFEGFKRAGVERLIELLNHLHITFEDVEGEEWWMSLLLDVMQSSEGTQRLSDCYWELLVELVISEPWSLEFGDIDALKIAESLIDAEQWGKLECWIETVWMYSNCAGDVRMAEEDFENSMLLLFRQRPGAAQRLERWMERWSQEWPGRDFPESFQRILTRAQEAVKRQDAL